MPLPMRTRLASFSPVRRLWLTLSRFLSRERPSLQWLGADSLKNYLSIKPEIISAADGFQRKFFTSDQTIAVHVRNTDNQKSARFRVDTSRHITILRRLSRKMTSPAVFLATDSRATELLYRSL